MIASLTGIIILLVLLVCGLALHCRDYRDEIDLLYTKLATVADSRDQKIRQLEGVIADATDVLNEQASIPPEGWRYAQ
jgi:hypothetical protein